MEIKRFSSFPGLDELCQAGSNMIRQGGSPSATGVKRIGENATIREIYEISEVTCNLVRDSFGPAGLWNIVVDETGYVHRLRTGSAILNRIAPKKDTLKEPKQSEESGQLAVHPVTEIMSEMAGAVTRSVGDGSKAAIILTAEILGKKFNSTIDPAIFLDGCLHALVKSVELIRESSIPLLVTRSGIRKIVKTFFDAAFMPEESAMLANVIVGAVAKKLQRSDNGTYLLDSDVIGIKREIGGSILDTRVLDGVAFSSDIPNPSMPRIVENAKVALLSGALSSGFGRTDMKLRTRQYDHEIIIHEPDDMRALYREKTAACTYIVHRLRNLEVGAIMIGKGLEPEIEGMLAKEGILAVRNVYVEDLQRIARLTGGRIVSDTALLTLGDLGKAQFIKEEKIGGHSWIFIGGRQSGRVATVLVRGFSDAIIDDAESKIRDSLRVVGGFVSQPRIVLGGGATEVELAVCLRRHADTIGERQQIVIRQLAEALESIPAILATSCGLDPIDSVANLRMLHVRGKASMGIDVYKRELADMHEAGIYIPLPVYEQVIKSSFETAACLLRIDDIIASRVRQGGEYWKKRMQQFTEPRREKRIIKDYGIER